MHFGSKYVEQPKSYQKGARSCSLTKKLLKILKVTEKLPSRIWIGLLMSSYVCVRYNCYFSFRPSREKGLPTKRKQNLIAGSLGNYYRVYRVYSPESRTEVCYCQFFYIKNVIWPTFFNLLKKLRCATDNRTTVDYYWLRDGAKFTKFTFIRYRFDQTVKNLQGLKYQPTHFLAYM